MNEKKEMRPLLYEALKTYGESDAYPFHMPGHKRRLLALDDPFSIDITEIDGFDNLHHACGILAQAQARAAALYGSEEAFYLVNGSTGGLLSAVSACVPPGGKLLMARNCHKAVYHAAYLRGLTGVYLYPGQGKYGINGGISPEETEEALKRDREIRAVLITSPTYDGVVSDVKRIAETAHAYGVPLIVDEAHGAHFGLHPYFPDSAVSLGADLVIQSLHKTLPCPTQTSLLHVNGERIDREKLRRFLGIYQTSSPSYVFMAAIDRAVSLFSSEEGKRLMDEFTGRLAEFRRNAEKLSHLKLAGGELLEGTHVFQWDPSKLILLPEGADLDGRGLGRLLRERYHLEMEMEAPAYCLGIASVGDSPEGFARLEKALQEIDRNCGLAERRGKAGSRPVESQKEAGRPDGKAADVQPGRRRPQSGGLMPGKSARMIRPESVCTISEAMDGGSEPVLLEESAGRISAEFVYLYPPGIPLIAPGERITDELAGQLLEWRSRGYELQGTADYACRKIRVWVDRK